MSDVHLPTTEQADRRLRARANGIREDEQAVRDGFERWKRAQQRLRDPFRDERLQRIRARRARRARCANAAAEFECIGPMHLAGKSLRSITVALNKGKPKDVRVRERDVEQGIETLRQRGSLPPAPAPNPSTPPMPNTNVVSILDARRRKQPDLRPPSSPPPPSAA